MIRGSDSAGPSGTAASEPSVCHLGCCLRPSGGWPVGVLLAVCQRNLRRTMSLESDHGIQHGHDLEQPHAATTSSLSHDDEALNASEEDEDVDRIPRDLFGSSFRRREIPPTTTSSTTSSTVSDLCTLFIPDVPRDDRDDHTGGLGRANTVHELEDGLIGVYAQGSWLTVTTHGLPSGAEALKTSLISWSPSGIKRRVSLKADAVTLSSVAAETESLQLLCCDVAIAGSKVADWQQNAPLTVVLGNSYELRARQVRSHVVESGLIYDDVSKESQDSKQDGLTARGLEASAPLKKGASRLDDMTLGPHHPGRCDDQGRPWQAWVRWLSKRATLVKAMIKADPGKLNDALINV